MLNSSGTIVARYSYDPYGRATLVSGTNLATKQYAGYYTHQPSGLNLTKYRAYDSGTGRWLSRDPLKEREGANLYTFVWDDPTTLIDQLGLASGSFDFTTTTDIIDDLLRPSVINVKITYHPDSKCKCNNIRLVQTVSLNNGPSRIDAHVGQKDADVAYPFYPYQTQSSNGNPTSVDGPGSTKLSPDPFTQIFQTCAVCVETGQILGCINWRNSWNGSSHSYTPSSKNTPASDPDQDTETLVHNQYAPPGD